MIPFVWSWATISFYGQSFTAMLKRAVANVENEQKATVFGTTSMIRSAMAWPNSMRQEMC